MYMMTSNNRYQVLLRHLKQLKVETMKEYLPNIIESVNNKEKTFIEALNDLADKKLRFREERVARLILKSLIFRMRNALLTLILIINQVLIVI